MWLGPFLAVTVSSVAPIGGGNALTLPAQRHVVKIDGSWMLALQQDGAGGHALGFHRSDDDGRTWRWYAPIQDSPTHRDTADLLAVGHDIALVYSFEGPFLNGSTLHDVWFQWWRRTPTGWAAQAPVRIFDSTSGSTAYYRAELARDGTG